MKIGINGFGRIGRLVFRALWGRPGLTQLKVYAWYDNEWGYSCRMADRAGHVAAMETAGAKAAGR